ncbi:hypothetical protein [Hydromonas duriensis]|uniref:Uncharacterized protein n=1 Tax=Hydromonas duriensis TaxID=1527608 RepID=A0A4R6Y1D0_9BURK|nr:hypothetical protein [Hydromonas duriensis]TDR28956.1 hypothetical protein DFR44_13025 [Hydromonas duriensis]
MLRFMVFLTVLLNVLLYIADYKFQAGLVFATIAAFAAMYVCRGFMHIATTAVVLFMVFCHNQVELFAMAFSQGPESMAIEFTNMRRIIEILQVLTLCYLNLYTIGAVFMLYEKFSKSKANNADGKA